MPGSPSRVSSGDASPEAAAAGVTKMGSSYFSSAAPATDACASAGDAAGESKVSKV